MRMEREFRRTHLAIRLKYFHVIDELGRELALPRSSRGRRREHWGTQRTGPARRRNQVPLAPAPKQQPLPSIRDLLDVLPRPSTPRPAFEVSRVGAFRQYTSNVPTAANLPSVLIPREADAANTLLHISAVTQGHAGAGMSTIQFGNNPCNGPPGQVQQHFSQAVEIRQPVLDEQVSVSPRTVVQLPSADGLFHSTRSGDAVSDRSSSVATSSSSSVFTSPYALSTAYSMTSSSPPPASVEGGESRIDSLIPTRAHSVVSSPGGANANIANAGPTRSDTAGSEVRDRWWWRGGRDDDKFSDTVPTADTAASEDEEGDLALVAGEIVAKCSSHLSHTRTLLGSTILTVEICITRSDGRAIVKGSVIDSVDFRMKNALRSGSMESWTVAVRSVKQIELVDDYRRLSIASKTPNVWKSGSVAQFVSQSNQRNAKRAFHAFSVARSY
nr:hypothetical protein CFP56_70417 [Quercus suber]